MKFVKKMTDKEVCMFALSGIFRYAPHLGISLLEENEAEDIFGMCAENLEDIFGPYNKYRNAIFEVNLKKEEEKLRRTLDSGCRILTYRDDDYPFRLKQCPDAPLCLFIKSRSGNKEIFRGESISVVGTRDASPYGTAWCGKIVRSLAGSSKRPAVVSGLAFGIDIAAHKAALENGLPTIAVLGNGIDAIYPHQHEGYAKEISETPACAVISEYPAETETKGINFLSRNRIIAGLSDATVLVESKLKGGGMSTARLAASYDRSVFAVPGRNDDIRSQGCNNLIHSQIAEALISCDEFFKSLGYKYKRPGRTASAFDYTSFYSGSIDRFKLGWVEKIMGTISGKRGLTIQDIADNLALPYKDVLAIAWRLESDGFIKIDILQRCTLCSGH